MNTVKVSRDAAQGMDELTPMARRAMRSRAWGCDVLFVVTQRWTQRHTYAQPDKVFNRERALREVGRLAISEGARSPDVAGVIDLSNRPAVSDAPNQQLVWTLPVSARREDNGTLPAEAPDYNCVLDFRRAVYLLVNGKQSATVVVHCNHGCNRTGVLLIQFLYTHAKNPTYGTLEALIEEFAAARHALPDRPMGIYEPEALWRLHILCGFLPPPRPLPRPGRAAAPPAPLPPRRQPKFETCNLAAYANAGVLPNVPMPYLRIASNKNVEEFLKKPGSRR